MSHGYVAGAKLGGQPHGEPWWRQQILGRRGRRSRVYVGYWRLWIEQPPPSWSDMTNCWCYCVLVALDKFSRLLMFKPFLQVQPDHQPPELIRPWKAFKHCLSTCTSSLFSYFLIISSPSTHICTSRAISHNHAERCDTRLNFQKCIPKMLWYIVICVPARLCTASWAPYPYLEFLAYSDNVNLWSRLIFHTLLD